MGLTINILLQKKNRCFILGEWNPDCNMVLYPFTRNDLTARTHDSYLDAAREAQRRSNGRKDVSIDGIKGLSTLLQV